MYFGFSENIFLVVEFAASGDVLHGDPQWPAPLRPCHVLDFLLKKSKIKIQKHFMIFGRKSRSFTQTFVNVFVRWEEFKRLAKAAKSTGNVSPYLVDEWVTEFTTPR